VEGDEEGRGLRVVERRRRVEEGVGRRVRLLGEPAEAAEPRRDDAASEPGFEAWGHTVDDAAEIHAEREGQGGLDRRVAPMTHVDVVEVERHGGHAHAHEPRSGLAERGQLDHLERLRRRPMADDLPRLHGARAASRASR